MRQKSDVFDGRSNLPYEEEPIEGAWTRGPCYPPEETSSLSRLVDLDDPDVQEVLDDDPES